MRKWTYRLKGHRCQERAVDLTRLRWWTFLVTELVFRKSEYDRANFTVEGIRRNMPLSALHLPLPDNTGDATVRVVPAGDRWLQVGKHWMRIHALPRNTSYIPQLEDGGPELSILLGTRTTFMSYT